MVETCIADIRRNVTGELTGRTKVIDHLLDLRLAAADRPLVVSTIDALLADTPGRSTVSNAWLLAALTEVERSAAGALIH